MFKRNSIRIWAGGKVVGEVVGNVFQKKVRGSKHMLREPKGWALDCQSLEDAVQVGAEVVELVDVETDTTYSATVARIHSKGFRLDRGFGQQIALALQHWSTRRPGEAQQLAFAMT